MPATITVTNRAARTRLPVFKMFSKSDERRREAAAFLSLTVAASPAGTPRGRPASRARTRLGRTPERWMTSTAGSAARKSARCGSRPLRPVAGPPRRRTPPRQSRRAPAAGVVPGELLEPSRQRGGQVAELLHFATKVQHLAAPHTAETPFRLPAHVVRPQQAGVGGIRESLLRLTEQVRGVALVGLVQPFPGVVGQQGPQAPALLVVLVVIADAPVVGASAGVTTPAASGVTLGAGPLGLGDPGPAQYGPGLVVQPHQAFTPALSMASRRRALASSAARVSVTSRCRTRCSSCTRASIASTAVFAASRTPGCRALSSRVLHSARAASSTETRWCSDGAGLPGVGSAAVRSRARAYRSASAGVRQAAVSRLPG